MNRVKYIFIFIILCFLISCKTTNKVSYKYKKVEKISTKHLLNNVYNSSKDCSTIFIKKGSVSITQNGKTNNLKSSIKIDKENFIQISLVAPLGIEIARALLTLDSVKFVNFHDKEYFFDNINNINKLLNINSSYSLLQGILSNSFFGLYDFEDKDLSYSDRHYSTEINSDLYTLSTYYKKKNNGKYSRVDENNKNISIYQICKINPNNFRVTYNCIKDVENNLFLEVKYSDFRIYQDVLFPSKMQIILKTKKDNYKLNLKILNLAFDVPVNSNIRILKKYKNIKDNE